MKSLQLSPYRLPLSILAILVQFAGLGIPFVTSRAADPELTNYKSGISAIWGGTKGVDYVEEYLYHDKTIWDMKVVYLRSTTPITLSHNERNIAWYSAANGGRQVIGVNGKDGIPNSGDEGIIRYKIDYERNWEKRWSAPGNRAEMPVYPAYTGPFTLASQSYESNVPVVGTTGGSGPSPTMTGYYERGLIDTFGDEWHVLAYADDMRSTYIQLPDSSYDSADDGKTVLLIVDPKAPALTVRATGDGQFYTTPPKAYFTPKICDQTTFFSVGKGTVNFEIRDLFGKNVFYRVGGKGDFINARSSAVTLAGSLFAPGTNTLQYYYNGNEKYTKTRIVVKNPSFPSAAEKHGHYLFGDTAQTAKVLARAKRPPYSSYYENYKTRRDSSGQEAADTTMAAPGLRQRAQNGYANTLGNVIVAKIAGWKYTIPGSRLSSGQYAKFMMLNNTRIIDPLGFELSHSADAIPSRELHLRGYYDSDPVQETLFTYDLFAENFRSDQVDGGMTAIEDYFVRDRLAGFAFEAMQWSAGINLMDSPGLWGTARMMTGVEIGLVMSEYSTSYYGTSGFGSVQSTYMLCPYQNDQLTWKQALFDANTPKTSYPDYKWGTGISGRGRDDSLIPTGEFIFANNTWPPFTWSIKSAYFSSGQMGKHLTIWANMAKRFAGGYTDPGLEVAMLRASLGTLMSAGDGFPSPNSRFTQLLVCNPLWPQIVSNTIPYALTLPDSDPNSFRSAWPGFYALFWYDDTKSIPQAPKNLRLKVASTAATLPK